MFKPLFILFICITSCRLAFGQKNNQHDTTAYYMRTPNVVANTEADAKLLRLIIKKKSDLFEIQDYYMDATPKLIAHSTIGTLYFDEGLQGEYIEYYPNGVKKYECTYNNGKLVGNRVDYYPSGKVYSEITYNSPGKQFLKTCYDTTGNLMAENGNGRWVKYLDGDQGNVIFGPVVNGKEEGVWKLHTPHDLQLQEFVYKNGVIVGGEENFYAKKETFTAVERAPSFPGGDLEFTKYIARNVKYPEVARKNKIEGRVIVSFVIERDGSLTDVKVTRGIGSGCDEEAVRVIKASPKWLPGIQNDKPVRVQYSVPVSFSIN